jgi:predicted small secreted protein
MKHVRILPLLLLLAAVALAGCSGGGGDIKKLDANCDTDTACQKAMASLLATPGAKPKIEKALLNSKKSNEQTRKNLAYLLGQYAESRTDKSVFDTLKKAFETDKSDAVRAEIVRILPKIPGDDWVPLLKTASEDKNGKVAQAARDALHDLAADLIKRADGYAARDDTIISKADLYAQALDYTPCDGDLSQKTAALYTEYADIVEGRSGEAADEAAAGKLLAESEQYRQKAAATENACGLPVRAMYVALPIYDAFKDNTLKLDKINPADDEYSGIPAEVQDEGVYWEAIPDELQDKVVIHMSRLIDEWGVDASGEFSSYATFMASADKAQDIGFRINSDTHIALWVNGKEVFRSGKDRPTLKRDLSAKAKLKAGDNRVVVKLFGETNLSRFKLRILGAGGKPITGLKLEAR